MSLDRDETETTLINLPEAEFVQVWCEVVGEVPAVIAERTEMVDILLGAVSPSDPDRRSPH